MLVILEIIFELSNTSAETRCNKLELSRSIRSGGISFSWIAVFYIDKYWIGADDLSSCCRPLMDLLVFSIKISAQPCWREGGEERGAGTEDPGSDTLCVAGEHECCLSTLKGDKFQTWAAECTPLLLQLPQFHFIDVGKRSKPTALEQTSAGLVSCNQWKPRSRPINFWSAQ